MAAIERDGDRHRRRASEGRHAHRLRRARQLRRLRRPGDRGDGRPCDPGPGQAPLRLHVLVPGACGELPAAHRHVGRLCASGRRGAFICGASPEADLDPDWSDEDPASQEIDHAFFEEFIWPSLAHRVPAFEAIRPGRAWSGPYDMCLLDHNAIVGTAGEIEKFLSLQRLLGPRAAAGAGRRTRPCRADRPWRIPDARPVRTRLRARARQQAAPRAQRDLARRGPSRAIRLYATRSSLAVSRSPRPGSSLLRGFFRSDTPPTRRRSGSFPVAGVKSFGGRGFHFEAGYDCHIFVIETSLGLNAMGDERQ